MRYILLLAFLGACDGTVDPDAYTMAPGARLTVSRFTAADGDSVSFVVTGALGQPVAVGVAYDGAPDDVHKSYAFIGAAQSDPYTDETPHPLLAGPYRVDLGCGEEATAPCVFRFSSERP